MKKEFLDLLAEKLNTGSMRNIYLNALPSRYKARMDFFDIIDCIIYCDRFKMK